MSGGAGFRAYGGEERGRGQGGCVKTSFTVWRLTRRKELEPPVSIASTVARTGLALRATQRAADRRRYRRMPVAIGARLLANGDEAPCRTLDFSCGGALVEALDWPQVGAPVVLYARDIGRVAGEVVRHVPERGFGMRFEIGPYKRERLAEILTLKANPQADAAREIDSVRRAAPRFAGDGQTVVVELEDGRSVPCEILDFSLFGVAVRTPSLRPPLGAMVKIGATRGRVARFIEGGFAVDFGPRALGAAP